MDDTSPINQNVISGRCVIGLARYFIMLKIEDISPPISMPERIIEIVLSDFTNFDKMNTNKTVMIPNKNENN